MGRPKLYHTVEEQKEAKRQYEKTYLSKEGKKAKRLESNKKTQSERWKRWYEKNRMERIIQCAMATAEKLKRTPPWADLEAIKEFYRNRPPDHHVDHIIPLRGKIVSGLHVMENLQYLPASINCSKSNKYTLE